MDTKDLVKNPTKEDQFVDVRRVTLSCHNVSYSVTAGKLCNKKKLKILNGLSGVFKPGLNAILGPTGSGKSTFLDVLTGQKKAKRVEGKVLIDGTYKPNEFNKFIGFVSQEDMLMESLTVRENMRFSADLRLQGCEEEKEASVLNVLSLLQLNKCAHNKIKDVSSGERRRVSIAMEMMKQPRILFLDEPTTGLDANSALSVVSLLHRLSLKGMTVVLTIHQPRYSIFKLFDTLTIISNGNFIYHGISMEALQYFQSLGYNCEKHDNPCDFFMDVLSKHPPSRSLVELFDQSRENENLNYELKKIDKACVNQQPHIEQEYVASFMTQLKVLSKRSLKNLSRSYHANAVQLMVSSLFAVIIGLLFLKINDVQLPLEVSLQNRTGAFFYMLVNQLFMAVSEVVTFIGGRNLFWHEHVQGYYRTSSYFITKILFDSLLMKLLSGLAFALITFFLIEFDSSVGSFLAYYYSLMMLIITACCFCYFIGSLVSSPAIAQTLVTFFFVAMALLSGFLSNLGEMDRWISWLSHFSILKYALHFNYAKHLKDLHMTVNNGSNTYIDTHSATGRLLLLGVKHENSFDVWNNLLSLHLYSCFLLAATYLRLRFVPKHK